MAKAKTPQYYEAVGRRKSAVARVRLYIPGKEKSVTVEGISVKQGDILVNKKPVNEVFPSIVDKTRYLIPLNLVESQGRFVITTHIQGGGKKGQLEAFIHGLSRALEKVDKETYRPVLKKEQLLRRDARIRERRKVGTGGKARRQKQSPKR